MRYAEIIIENEDDHAKLANLQRQLAELMTRWQTIKNTEPKNAISRDNSAWWNDPERGGLWPEQIYPLNQQIDQLKAEIKRQERTKTLQFRRSDVGFDTSEILYHGTDAAFKNFDRTKARTAAHIYTSPDIDTARQYGSRLYAVYGRQEPQANLTAENPDYAVLRRIHRYGGFKREWDLSLAALTELITDGQLYSYSSNSHLQDAVIDACLGLKFKSVRITDGIPGGRGGFSDSVIFGNPDDLQIVEELDP